MSYPPPPEPFPSGQPFPPPSEPAFPPQPDATRFDDAQADPARPADPGPPPGPYPGQHPGQPMGYPGQPGPPGPYPGQPAFQPGVASPAYPQQPGYDPTQVGYPPPGGSPYAPGYPPPGPYPGYGPGRPGGPPGKRGSAALLWSLIAVFAVLLCAGAATAGFVAYRNSSETPPVAGPGPRTPAAPGPGADPSAGPTAAPSEGPGLPPGNPGASLPPGVTGPVAYEVTGEGRPTIQFLGDASAGVQRVTDARLPWREELDSGDGLYFLTLTATRDSGSGPLACRIIIDGKVVVEDTANGQYAIVNCFHLKLD